MSAESYKAGVWASIVESGEEIGHDVVISPFPQPPRERAGILFYHRHADGSVCGRSVTFAHVPGRGPRWTVVQSDPLMLSPSIRVSTCSEDLHGSIVNGEWTPC